MEPQNSYDKATTSANTSLNCSPNHSINVEEHMQDSESDYKLGDSEINSSDSEWSSNDEVAINILKKTSKYKRPSSDSDSDSVPLASWISRQRKRSKTKKRQEAIDIATEVLQSIIESIPPQEINHRKRKRNEEEWIQNKAKTLRNSGKKYKSKKGGIERKAREIGRGCTQKCRIKCHSRVSEEERQTVFNRFWQLEVIERQRDFIVKNVSKLPKNRNSQSQTRRSFTFCYSFDVKGQKTAVCKHFFLQTLGISAQMVETAFNKQNEAGICVPDQRGRQRSENSLEEERRVIKEHIQSFPRVPSHYCRKETGKEFPECHMTIEKMYSLYKEAREKTGAKPASKWVYRDVLVAHFNISFHHRNKDQCATCTSYRNPSDEEKEKMQEEYDEHMREKELMFTMKEGIKKEAVERESHASAVFDMEEVLTTPKLFVGDAYYLRKLNTYNFTVYNYGTDEVFCYLWPEYVASRGSNEVASCVVDYIGIMAKRNVKTVTLISDSCGGQNRNRTMAFALWYSISKYNLTSIKHQFLVVGHTFNEGDSAHSAIENASRKIEIYTPSQWAATIRTASHKRQYIVQEQTTDDFRDYKQMSDALPNLDLDEQRNRVKWMSIRSIEVHASEPDILNIRYTCHGEVSRLNVNTGMKRNSKDFKRVNPAQIKLKSTVAKPIANSKYNDLCKMCDKNFIPRAHHNFYRNLPHE